MEVAPQIATPCGNLLGFRVPSLKLGGLLWWSSYLIRKSEGGNGYLP